MENLKTVQITMPSNDSSKGYYLKTDTIYNNSDPINNTSNITIDFYAYGNYSYYLGQANGVYAYIDLWTNQTNEWSRKKDGILVPTIPNREWLKIATWTGDVSHNADGTLNIESRAIFLSQKITGYMPKKGEYYLNSGSLPLQTIPRATNISFSVETFPTKTYGYKCSPASSNFRHKLVLNIGNWNYTSDYFYDSLDIPFPNTLFDQVPNTRFAEGTQTLITYNGTTEIGRKSGNYQVQLNPNDAKPIIGNKWAYDLNNSSIDLTKDNYILVKNLSNVFVQIGFSIPYGGVLKNPKINNGTADESDGYITKSNLSAESSYSYSLETTRDLTSVSGTFNSKEVVNYFTPYLNANFKRKTQTSNQIQLSLSGRFFNAKFGSNINAVKNTLRSLEFRYKTNKNDNWSSWLQKDEFVYGDLVINADGTFTIPTSDLVGEYDYQQQVIFQIRFGDTPQELLTKEYLITKGTPTFAIGETKCMYKGKTLLEVGNNGVMEIGYAIDFHNDINDKITDYNMRLSSDINNRPRITSDKYATDFLLASNTYYNLNELGGAATLYKADGSTYRLIRSDNINEIGWRAWENRFGISSASGAIDNLIYSNNIRKIQIESGKLVTYGYGTVDMFFANCNNIYNFSMMSSYMEVLSSGYPARGIATWDSDISYKKDITLNEDNATDLINQIPIKSFTWNDKAGESKENIKVKWGVVAQDLEKVDEEFVFKVQQYDEEQQPTGELLNPDYTKLIPLLIKSNQELSKRVDELEKQIKNKS